MIGLVVPTAVRWSDADAFGHVNNVAVLRLLEEARIAALDELAVRVGDGGPSLLETGVVVARHEIEYRRQLVWRRGPVPVRVWVTGVGGSSFELGYAVGGGESSGAGAGGGGDGATGRGYGDGVDGDALTSLATTTVVAMGPGGTAARRLTPAERAALRGWTGEPVPFRPRSARRG